MSEVEPNGEIFFLLREGTLIGSQSRAGVLRLIDSESKVDALWLYAGKQQRTPTILLHDQASAISIVSEEDAWAAAQKVE
ncbi:hypothetical protein HY948_00345 [Candidatus Gottesmanbacteria bacterium]|nr:hypothetical protein [Candidatus Gottesmanbacteria bacterium]